ncbi:hypothetical protein C8R45DRAFT_1215473 [Mycena sanguinolenta]|nr:hypothetical protein C8R45DRAFT_1215473 [Mycena sanguinolenta]
MLLPPPSLQVRNMGNDNAPASFPPSTWIPIVVVVSVLLVLSILACTRKSFRARMASMGTGVAVAAGGMPGTRELTAEQLAGSINNAGTQSETNGNGGTTVAIRRPRRTRRTPSQISTVSLPAYMKEPGEQELVVTRGPDGEDVAMPAASAVEDPDEDESNEGHDAPRRASTHVNLNDDDERYERVPQSPHDTPLLGDLDYPLEAELDPRGDAPAYFEFVVDPADNDAVYPPGIPSPIVSPAAPPAAPASPAGDAEAQTQAQTQRRSGFFSTLFRSAPPPPVPPIPTSASPPPLPTDSAERSGSRLTLTHTRTRSTTSPVNGTRHRASTSTSTLFSLGRKKSTPDLSSPYANNNASMISLASISSPLPHTLMKTEFTALPKAGLTPEQLMLISGNKDGGLTRFGVPWGAAAVAYASASRVNLASSSEVVLGEDEAPPPGWEEVGGSGEASGSGSTQPEASDSSTHPEHIPLPASPLARADSHRSHMSGMSVQTFATAHEVESPSHSDVSDDESEDEHEAEVPRISIHVQEPTDATVRPVSGSFSPSS